MGALVSQAIRDAKKFHRRGGTLALALGVAWGFYEIHSSGLIHI